MGQHVLQDIRAHGPEFTFLSDQIVEQDQIPTSRASLVLRRLRKSWCGRCVLGAHCQATDAQEGTGGRGDLESPPALVWDPPRLTSSPRPVGTAGFLQSGGGWLGLGGARPHCTLVLFGSGRHC